MLRVLIYLGTFAVLLPSAAFSATITKINTKTGAILINEGEASGFSKGKTACIFDGAKKLTCGKIAKATKTKADLRVPVQAAATLKNGNTVTLSDTTNTPSTTQKKVGSQKEPEPQIPPRKYSLALNMHFLPMTPASYGNLEYIADTAGNTSFWKADSTASSMLLPPGFGAEMEMLNWGLIFGLRFGFFAGSSILTDADGTTSNVMTTSLSATDFALYLDYIYYKRWGVNFAAGLDFDMNSVKLSASSDNGSGAVDVYSATSQLNIVSLRLPFIYKYAFGRFGLSAAFDLLVPLVAMGPTTTVSNAPDLVAGATAPTGTKVPVDDTTDTTEALAHKKQSLAVDLVVGFYFEF